MPSVRLKPASRPNQPRSLPPPTPMPPSRRPWLPAPAWKRKVASPRSRRVKIWITPPMASEPYRLERGPRTISTRSISEIGRSWNETRPEVAEPTRTPSISTSTWSDSLPRTNIVVSLPSPPWLAMLMPARPRSRSASDVAWARRISSRVMISTGASAASAVTAVRVAVTMMSSSSSPASTLAAKAMPGSRAAMARLSGRIRDRPEERRE